jgi:hypothetical protein
MYGPESTGKTTAVIQAALMLTRPMRERAELPMAALTEPEAYLGQLQAQQSPLAHCIFVIHANVDKHKTASHARSLSAYFRTLRQLHTNRCGERLRSPRVVIVFEEVDKVPCAFFEPLMTLFDGGYMVDSSCSPPERVYCPLPLVILCTGNSLESSVLRRDKPFVEADVRREIERILANGAINSRVVKWLVPFYPNGEQQLRRILKACTERLLRHALQFKRCAQPFELWTLDRTFRSWMSRQFRTYAYVVRRLCAMVSIKLRAAICQARPQIDLWSRVCLTVQDEHIVPVCADSFEQPLQEEKWMEKKEDEQEDEEKEELLQLREMAAPPEDAMMEPEQKQEREQERMPGKRKREQPHNKEAGDALANTMSQAWAVVCAFLGDSGNVILPDPAVVQLVHAEWIARHAGAIAALQSVVSQLLQGIQRAVEGHNRSGQIYRLAAQRSDGHDAATSVTLALYMVHEMASFMQLACHRTKIELMQCEPAEVSDGWMATHATSLGVCSLPLTTFTTCLCLCTYMCVRVCDLR